MPRLHRTTNVSIERLESRACPAVVSISGSAALEEADGPITLTARLSEAQRTPVEVRYLVSGTAKLGADYRASIGTRSLGTSGSFTFRPGQTVVSITVRSVNDTLREPTESFSIRLTSARGHSIGDRTATVTINDDDQITASLVGPARINPEGVGTFTLRLSAPRPRTETFYVSTQDISAEQADDYFPLTNLPVVIRAGETSQTFRVSAKPNTPAEYDEVFGLTARAVSADFPMIADLGVVIPGIGPEPVSAISVNDVSVNEGDTGVTTASFTVTLSKAYSVPVTVAYATADGTARVSDFDYAATNGILSFRPGETQKTIEVLVAGDTRPEPSETFSLILSSPTNATITRGTGVATIVNDDGQEGFQITVKYLPSEADVLPTVRAAVTQAVAKWEQIIVGDLPSFVNPFNGERVDDIVLNVRMGLLGVDFPTGTDGNTGRNVIANAGPFFGAAPGADGVPAIRNTPLLPYWGTIGFDPANAASDSAASLYVTALHEIGHALGFGSPLFFEPRVGYPNGLVVLLGGNQANPVYIGTAAVQAYNQIFQRNAVNIRMESDTGSAGTDRVHWDDLAVPGELMTGFVVPGQPLSQITVSAMQDLGYTVNLAAADPYNPRAAGLGVTAANALASTAPTTPTARPTGRVTAQPRQVGRLAGAIVGPSALRSQVIGQDNASPSTNRRGPNHAAFTQYAFAMLAGDTRVTWGSAGGKKSGAGLTRM